MKELYTSPEATLISFMPVESIANNRITFNEIMAAAGFSGGQDSPASVNDQFDLEGDL